MTRCRLLVHGIEMIFWWRDFLLNYVEFQGNFLRFHVNFLLLRGVNANSIFSFFFFLLILWSPTGTLRSNAWPSLENLKGEIKIHDRDQCFYTRIHTKEFPTGLQLSNIAIISRNISKWNKKLRGTRLEERDPSVNGGPRLLSRFIVIVVTITFPSKLMAYF